MERQLQFGNDKQSVLILYYSTLNLYTENKRNIILITDTSASSIEQRLHRIEGKFKYFNIKYVLTDHPTFWKDHNYDFIEQIQA